MIRIISRKARGDFLSVVVVLDLVRCVRQLVDGRGIAALWVTHRLDELDYCDGAFLLENGRVVASGKPAAMRDRLLASQSAL